MSLQHAFRLVTVGFGCSKRGPVTPSENPSCKVKRSVGDLVSLQHAFGLATVRFGCSKTGRASPGQVQ